jgi:hypothetical protein
MALFPLKFEEPNISKEEKMFKRIALCFARRLPIVEDFSS